MAFIVSCAETVLRYGNILLIRHQRKINVIEIELE